MEKKINSKVIFGRRNTVELVQKLVQNQTPAADFPFREVLVKKNSNKEIFEKVIKFLPREIKITYVSGGDLDSMLPGKNHQGIVLLAKERQGKDQYKPIEELYDLIENHKSTILILDRIMDIGNFGSIIRTAECFGVKHIIVPERDMAPINESVEKISSGALHHLSMYRVTNLTATIEKLKKFGYWIVATGDSGKEDWDKLPDTKELAIIIGNEENGVKRLLIEESDFFVKIPLYGKVSSLNASIACGIILDRITNRTK
jgi:23S rRNA (guanosine2251-2'-O)-methyltransferase